MPKDVSQCNDVLETIQSKNVRSLLENQSGICYFCAERIPDNAATTEHLLPQSKGGKRDGGNCVVVCDKANHFLGDLDLNLKIKILISRGGKICPYRLSSEEKQKVKDMIEHLKSGSLISEDLPAKSLVTVLEKTEIDDVMSFGLHPIDPFISEFFLKGNPWKSTQMNGWLPIYTAAL